MANVSSVKDTLVDLMSQVSSRISGDWHHYRCFKCDDHSNHLGINVVTGAVKCLRCGFKFSLNGKGASTPHVLDSIDYSLFSMEHAGPNDESGMFPFDNQVVKYMASRDVVSKTGWGYGRGNLTGKPVFPAVDKDGMVNYIQWKTTDRYRSMKHTVPRFDYYPILYMAPKIRSVIILVEGPIDAHVTRQHTGLWCSPMYGTNPGPFFMRDLFQAYSLYSVEKVLLMLDNDSTGQSKMYYFYWKLKLEYGITVEMVNIRGRAKDPAEFGGFRALYKHL